MRLNHEAYKEGFKTAIYHVKEAMLKASEEASQQGVPSKTMGPEEALKTTRPFGTKGPAEKENLADIVMKDAGQGQGNGERPANRFSHGPSSTTSGSGTSNY
jgi:hypothetical protein